MKFDNEKQYLRYCKRARDLYKKHDCSLNQVSKTLKLGPKLVWSMLCEDKKHKERWRKLKVQDVETEKKTEIEKAKKKMEFEEASKGCPMNDVGYGKNETGYCAIRTAISKSETTEKSFEDQRCTKDNCPVFYLMLNLKDKMIPKVRVPRKGKPGRQKKEN